ncbi:MAG: DUF4965 domain-containing protein [Phycisphaeraceae bacterium]|nr:DUF4965 domain-containing protein [Phycisphaeraceae bacterium]
MQLMTWTLSRLGSRFNLLFEPYKRRVMHSAVGRFLDVPLDLQVGLIEPDGTERVLPFSAKGELFYNCEQFERLNSITFRGFSEKYKLRFEFNVHAVFYPQDEALCTMPAFYLEMRLNPADRIRWETAKGPRPDKVKLFIRLDRPATQIVTTPGIPGSDGSLPRIDMAYRNGTRPRVAGLNPSAGAEADFWEVSACDRIVSLNPEAQVDPDGKGLTCELPVTEVGSGIKWRLVWGACCNDTILKVTPPQGGQPATGRFRYLKQTPNIDAVIADAIDHRDERLTLSRRLEKLFDQASLGVSQRHLVHQGFQAFLSNTFWCDLADGQEWYSVWEGSCYFHSTVDVEYNASLFYLCFWPRLLAMQLYRWSDFGKEHSPSGGAILSHDIGWAVTAGKQVYPHDMPVEENANYLLLLQTYCHWTGDLQPLTEKQDFVEKLARYLLWTDRDASGFPSEGVPNTIDDASPAVQFSRKQTYLAVKRLAALAAAADLLARAGRNDLAELCRKTVDADKPKIEKAAWLGDHYAVCVDRSAVGVLDAWTQKPIEDDQIQGWDGYSIYTGNGLLFPAMIGQPLLLDFQHLQSDLLASAREAMSPYGCGHSSFEPENVWISQNLWRDHLAMYLGGVWPIPFSGMYWDMLAMSNTGQQSKGFIDTYINNNLCFYPRGVTSIGYLLAQPRLTVDRLAPGPRGPHITVNPVRHIPQRWPLFALADWKARKIPVCVVDVRGKVSIEGQTDPVVIRGDSVEEAGVIG